MVLSVFRFTMLLLPELFLRCLTLSSPYVFSSDRLGLLREAVPPVRIGGPQHPMR